MSNFFKATNALFLTFPLGIIALQRLGASSWWGAGLGAIGIISQLEVKNRRLLHLQLFLLSFISIPLFVLKPDNLVRIYPFILSASAFSIFVLSWKDERPALVKYASLVVPITTERERFLKSMMPLWTVALGINCLIFFVLLFDFPLEYWAWYAGFYSYIFLMLVFFATIVARLKFARKGPSSTTSIDSQSSEVNRFIHAAKMILGFSTFGIACFIFYFAIPLIWMASLGKVPRFQRKCRWLCHKTFAACVWYARYCGVIDIRFIEEGDAKNPRLLVCNHISMFDIVSILAEFEDCTTFVKYKFFRNPFLWPMITSCGFLPINEKNPQARVAATQKALAILQAGGRLVVFPEGTRSKDGSIGPFQNGVFRMAISTGIAVTPVVFQSDAPFLNSESASHQARGLITMRGIIKSPISPPTTDLSRSDAAQFREAVRQKFVEWTSQSTILE